MFDLELKTPWILDFVFESLNLAFEFLKALNNFLNIQGELSLTLLKCQSSLKFLIWSNFPMNLVIIDGG